MALQLEARAWLLTPAQRCPLVRAAFLQVLALLPASVSPSFTQTIHDAVSAELGSLAPGEKPGCAELQVPLPARKITAVAVKPRVGGGDPPTQEAHSPLEAVLEAGSCFCFPPGGLGRSSPNHGPFCVQPGNLAGGC